MLYPGVTVIISPICNGAGPCGKVGGIDIEGYVSMYNPVSQTI
jgi:hypothetical protein